jgi:hypothetical protein
MTMCKQFHAVNWQIFVERCRNQIYWNLFLLLLFSLILIPTNTNAQGNGAPCASWLDEITQSVQQNSHHQGVLLARRYLTYCSNDNRNYAIGLSALAGALNGDNQHEEAVTMQIGVFKRMMKLLAYFA